MSKTPVLVWIGTYNHEPYIKKCIDAVLMQKTNFNFDIIITEDCSEDQTFKICESYKNKFKDKIKLISAKENTKGLINAKMYEQIPDMSYKYVALCEGDDYWTSIHKLQKQYDLLESQDDISGCFHNAILEDSKGKIIKENMIQPEANSFSLKEIFAWNSIEPTCSIFTRTNVFCNLPKWFKQKPCDFFIDILITLKGEFHFIDDNMAAHIKHQNGWSHQSRDKINNEFMDRYFILLEDPFFRESFYSEILNAMRKRMNIISYDYNKALSLIQ